MRAVSSWLVPAILGGAMGAAASIGYLHFVVPANEVYTLNVARIVNAERMVLSNGESKGGVNFNAAETELFHVNHTLKNLVEHYSRNHLVVVKQAVVGGPSIDITNAVLTKLGLPLTAPKIDMGRLMAEAPGAGDPPLEKYLNHQKLEYAQKGLKESENLNKERTNSVLP